MPLFKLDDTTTIYLFDILLYPSVLISTNNCSVDPYNGDLQTTTVFFTRNVTSHKADYSLLSALSCLFIVLRKQSNERSWSRIFVFSLSREFYCDFIVVCVLCTHCLLLQFPSFSYGFWWFTGNKLAAFICVVAGVEYFSYFVLMSSLGLEPCLFL